MDSLASPFALRWTIRPPTVAAAVAIAAVLVSPSAAADETFFDGRAPLILSAGGSSGYAVLGPIRSGAPDARPSGYGFGLDVYGRVGYRLLPRLAVATESAALLTATSAGTSISGEQLAELESTFGFLGITVGVGVAYGKASSRMSSDALTIGPAGVVRAYVAVPNSDGSRFFEPALEVRLAGFDGSSAGLIGVSLAWGR